MEEQLVTALIQQSDELRELKAELALLKEQFETQAWRKFKLVINRILGNNENIVVLTPSYIRGMLWTDHVFNMFNKTLHNIIICVASQVQKIVVKHDVALPRVARNQRRFPLKSSIHLVANQQDYLLNNRTSYDILCFDLAQPF